MTHELIAELADYNRVLRQISNRLHDLAWNHATSGEHVDDVLSRQMSDAGGHAYHAAVEMRAALMRLGAYEEIVGVV